jgi:hypothetical protein
MDGLPTRWCWPGCWVGQAPATHAASLLTVSWTLQNPCAPASSVPACKVARGGGHRRRISGRTARSGLRGVHAFSDDHVFSPEVHLPVMEVAQEHQIW